MNEIEIWHNPRCSKSRQTLFILQDHGYSPVVREYLKNPPTIYQLQQALAKLGLNAAHIIRTGEERFAQLGLTPDTDENTLIAAMSAHPILIERPIVFLGNEAAIGRPPENVLSLLKKANGT